MTLPSLPALPSQGSTDWYAYASGLHDVVTALLAAMNGDGTSSGGTDPPATGSSYLTTEAGANLTTEAGDLLLAA